MNGYRANNCCQHGCETVGFRTPPISANTNSPSSSNIPTYTLVSTGGYTEPPKKSSSIKWVHSDKFSPNVSGDQYLVENDYTPYSNNTSIYPSQNPSKQW
uniref:Ovule protein n=1 Tax=Mesocestoides corti TaxID=53468 RepID=A0A5K3FFD1_MESCO